MSSPKLLVSRMAIAIVVVGLVGVRGAEAQSLGQSAGQSAAASENPPRITQPIDGKQVMRLPRSTHPLATRSNDAGRVDGSLAMKRMMLLLKASDQQQAALQKLLSAQHDPESAGYQRWLTPEEFGARFGPADSDLDQVKAWLVEQGFAVGAVARGRRWIEFSGTAAQVEKAFQTEVHQFIVDGNKQVANARDVALPRALAPVVTGVLSLNNFPRRPLHGKVFQVQRDAESGKLLPVGPQTPSSGAAINAPSANHTHTSGNGTFHYLAPGDWAKIYNTTPLLTQGIDGSGISIAIVGSDSGVQLSDIRTFRQLFQLPASDPQVIVNGTDPGIFPFSSAEVEADLDIEWAGAIAPNATIKFVTSATTASTAGFDLSLAHIVDNRIAPIVSVSIGACELFLGPAGNAFLNDLYQQAAAEGMSVLSAAGDTGAAGCDPQVSDFPAFFGPMVNGSASTAYNVAVGGTMFDERAQDDAYWNANNRADLSSAMGYIPETIWNEACDPTTDANLCFNTFLYFLEAGSGGPSNCVQSTVVFDPSTGISFTCDSGYVKPSWQAGAGVPNDSARDLPDISVTAAGGHDGYLLCVEGSCQSSSVGGQTVLENASVVGGTSAGAPSLAGVVALLEQKIGAFQGLLNFNLYKLAAAQNAANCDSSNQTDPTQVSNCIFYDTTAGNNNVPGLAGSDAAAGFDLASGLGSINAAQLVQQWATAPKLRSKTKLGANAKVIQHGSGLPIQVVVSPVNGGGAPSGDFSLSTSTGTSLSGGTLNNGQFNGPIPNLPGGTYQLRAHYAGDAMFQSSDSSPIKVNVTPEDSTIAVQAWWVNLVNQAIPVDMPIMYGQQVGVQIDVHGKSGMGSPGGNVTVQLDGQTIPGSYALNAAGNVFVWLYNVGPSGLLPGTHQIVASYSGDASFKAITSSSVSLTIDRDGAIQITLFPLQYPWTAGVPIDLAMILGPWGEPVPPPFGKLSPTGTVQLYECTRASDGVCLHFAALGAALPVVQSGPLGPFTQVETRRTFTAGDHWLKAAYSGDTNYEGVSLDEHIKNRDFTISVAPAAQGTITLTQSAGTIPLGQSGSYTVSLRARGGNPVPTGTVSLFDIDFNQLVADTPLVNGTASFSVPWYHAGADFVFASYSGDERYPSLASAGLITNVSPARPTVRLTSPSGQVISGSQTTLSVLLGGGPFNTNILSAALEFGQVEYWDSLNGAPAQLLGSGAQFLTVGNGGASLNVFPITLTSGQHSITARFLGTEDWAATSSNTISIHVAAGGQSGN